MRIVLSIPQDFLDVLSSIGGIFYGNIKQEFIKAVCTDSRDCQSGDLFFAIKGENYDGNDFIKDVINKGGIPVGPGVKTFGIKTPSGNIAFLNFSNFYKKRLPKLLYTVAITGSVGKTTTKEFLKFLTSQRYKTHSTWQNFNNEVGVPFTILSAPSDTEVLICELGMNHRGEIKRLSDSLEPDIALITKIGSAHIGNLGSMEEIANAKLEIISSLKGPLIIPFGEKLLQNNYRLIKTHSAESKDATVSVLKNQFGLLEIYKKRELLEIIDYRFDGRHLYECLGAAVSLAFEMDIPHNEIIQGIKAIGKDSFRHKILKTPSGFYILDDSYNASLESMLSAFDMLSELRDYRQKSVLIGDVLELGEKGAEIHQTIGKAIAHYGFYNVFIIGEYADSVATGAINEGFPKSRILINRDIHSPEITSSEICQRMKAGDILLAKASHKTNMSRIINLIIGKAK